MSSPQKRLQQIAKADVMLTGICIGMIVGLVVGYVIGKLL